MTEYYDDEYQEPDESPRNYGCFIFIAIILLITIISLVAGN